MKNTPKPPTKTAKFIYVAKNKGESSKGDVDLKSISVHPNCLSIIAKNGETPIDYKFSIEEFSAKDDTR